MKRLYIGISAVATLALISLGCVKSQPKDPSTSKATSAPLPEITAIKLKKTLSSSKKPSIVNLWATWCEPCKVEMPELKKFRDSEAGKRVDVIFISADSDQAAAAKFLSEIGLDGPNRYHLVENADEFGKVFAPTWSATLPTTFITDAQGNLKTFWVGETTQKQLEEKVAKTLGPNASE